MPPRKRVPAFTLATVAFVISVSFASLTSQGATLDFSPQGLIKQRVSLYMRAAHSPLEKLAPEIYSFATGAERCRMASGAKACGLPAGPLPGSGLKQVFDYYVAQPVEAGLDRQKVEVHKSNWSWQARAGVPR
ncbi:MAG: hypothetical protein ACRD1I_00540 [Terriglobia bacterium]